MTHNYVSVLLWLLALPFALKAFVYVELFLHVGLDLLFLQDNRMGEMGNLILIVMIYRFVMFLVCNEFLYLCIFRLINLGVIPLHQSYFCTRTPKKVMVRHLLIRSQEL